MLGRQQIAGIPTAISEIFKNAYDAYATHVRGDFIPDRGVLMIRDNGVGMTLEDFKTRWLTVGTDSKAKGSALPSIPRPAGIPQRRQMGEKGIGRLAIATIGSQLLVATRAEREIGTPNDRVVLALIQWSLFEVPGLTLDDVVIPIRELAGLDHADLDVLQSMRSELEQALVALGDRVSPEYRERIRREMGHLSFDPRVLYRLNGPSLMTGPGTAFIATPVSDDVHAVMEVRDGKDGEFAVSEFQRFMLGFTNTITPDVEAPEFDTEFIRHDGPSPRDIIDPDSYFWDKEDFDTTDHAIEGYFDEYGSFTGRVSIYGAEAVEIQEAWPTGRGKPTACGPFSIKFGYVQGKVSESRLAPEQFVSMTKRLEKIGGLYVYRDGIRVLPYGNSDNDYLEIEKRRSLNAGTYYFSYRRMFGAIDLDSLHNPQLQEKAGREGFRENRAYRDFRDVLQNFLIQVAAHFFSSRAESSEEWRAERERLERDSTARVEKQKVQARRRAQFVKRLQSALDVVESGRFADAAEKCVIEMRRKVKIYEGTRDTAFLAAAEQSAMESLVRLRTGIEVARKEDMALSREDERDWNSYLRIVPIADATIAQSAAEIDAILVALGGSTVSDSVEADVEAGRRRRIDLRVEESRREVHSSGERVLATSEAVGKSIAAHADSKIAEFDRTVSELVAEAKRLGFADELRLISELHETTLKHNAALVDLVEQVQATIAAEGLIKENILLQEEVLDLQEQMDGNLELLQLGQAVQIVSHEFEASIRAVRNGLKDLAPWARSTPRLQPIVRDLRASFAHLDGYLRLFTPLQRRLYREVVEITGGEVEAFLRGVFHERLERHDVTLSVTAEFKSWKIMGYPSTFYPTFVNVVDNAIHWVSSGNQSGAMITLDADNGAAIIRDNGPGVRDRDRESIFDRGFSRRRGGRGLGLSLAKELLERDGWTIELVPGDSGARFRIASVGERNR